MTGIFKFDASLHNFLRFFFNFFLASIPYIYMRMFVHKLKNCIFSHFKWILAAFVPKHIRCGHFQFSFFYQVLNMKLTLRFHCYFQL